MVILDNSSITISTHAIATFLKNSGVILHCNQNHLPIGITLNLWQNTNIQKAILAQTQAAESQKSKIWKTIIQKKIQTQHNLLTAIGKESFLDKIIPQVKTGDSTNQEGRAARTYWTNLFGKNFTRERGDTTAPNCFLNYGYAILRSMVTQAICSAGLLPNLGIFHKHRSNPLPLADDLMEPLRTIVDNKTLHVIAEGATELTPNTKRKMAEITQEDLEFDITNLPIEKALQRYANSYLSALKGEPLIIPCKHLNQCG